ncbi:lipoprotein [uncultured Desulfosarcina sp.]|uniref:LPS translocon maturation chaperone LptM n=1 Tax=uncultured Desulfosarcina sp. TaxID=218289 RepID=UPI0029C97F9A|nr:lipoprotein [uncultured Desulfosarcina sp.]
MRNSISINCIVAALFLAVFSLAACGVKGPPIPPKAAATPAVALTYRLDDASVQLKWEMAADLSSKQARQATFTIYRSRRDLSEGACEDCPLVFEKISTHPFVQTDGNRFSSVETLDPGYGYAFKVRLKIPGQAVADSNTVRFEYPPAGQSSDKETP